MSKNEVKRFPLLNRGIVQKLDINQLEDGQYAYILNMVSQQEESLSPRYGYQDVTVNWAGAGITQPSLISSLAVTRDRGSEDPTLYAASYRTLTRVALSGDNVTGWTGVPANIATSITAADGLTRRIGSTQFKTDQLNDTGTSYFATGYNDPSVPFRGMLRDDGSQATARYVGILPPAVPAIPTIAAPEVVNIDRTTPYYFAAGGGGSDRVSTTITTATRAENVIGLGTGSTAGQDWLLVLADVTDIQVGMYLIINATLEGIVSSINSATSTIGISLSGTPAAGNTVKGFQAATQTAFPSGGTYRLEGSGGNTLLEDLSLSGTAATGYDSNDFIHISFYNGTPQTIANVVVRMYSTYNGWYETTLTIAETAPDYDASNPIPPYWIEFTVPKSDFTKNGVGSGDASWKNIFVIDYAVNCFEATDTCEFRIGNIFGYGGGGPNSASSGTYTPYDYVYTYIDPESGAESNPSQIMDPNNAISVANQNIKIIVWGCDNTTYNTGTTKIAIYRRGGSFTDGAFRRVGLVTNPGLTGSDPASAVFVDTLDDLSIINAKQAEFDNDAPVTSDLNREYVGTISAGQYYATVTVSNIGGVSLLDVMTPGTQVLIGGNKADGSFNQEPCTVFKVLSSTTFKTYMQYAHSADEQITWSTRAGIAGDLIMSAYDCLWMAGNPDNPHVLYRSKTGKPESWPVINEATGNSHQLAISSPDNPIMGLAEFNGEIVCMCKSGIYTVRMDSGVMRGPIKTPANRGLLKKHAWGYVDNAIWFLSYDGIYAWNGSSVTKMSFAIDFVFNNLEVNGIKPYAKDSSSSNADLCNIQQKGNEAFFNYYDSAGELNVLRYSLVFDRWNLEKIYDAASTVTDDQSNVSCLTPDRASGDLFGTKTTSIAGPSTVAGFILYDQVGFYKDGGTVAPGTSPILYQALSKVYDMGSPFVKKNFTDISVEVKSGLFSVNNTFDLDIYYDYSAVAGDTFSINPTTTTRQIVVNPLNISSFASAGEEARALQWKISGISSAANTWNCLSFGYIPLAELIRGRVTDWSDLGHPYDKRLNEVTIEYDNGNSAVQLYLDIVSGISGGTQELAKQSLTLPAATGRSKVTLPINDAIVAKLVRLRPVVASADYQIFDYSFTKDNYPADRLFFTDYQDYGYEYEKRLYQLYINCDTAGQNVSVAIEGDGSTLQTVTVNGTGSNRMQPIALNPDLIAKLIRLVVSPTAFSGNPSAKFQLFDHKFDFEQLPKPTVLSTPWSDFGYDYLKWAEQIAFDVNTNGYDVPVGVYCDGVLAQTVTVNSTQTTRNVNVTLNPGLTFKTMRLVVVSASIPSGGRFQLWDYQPIFRPADKGAVYHSFDWDNLDHPYDKKISEVTLEFETNATDSAIQVAVDTLTGINGATQNLNAITLTLPNTSAGRGYKTFPLPETVCKMVRIRSLGQSGGGTQSPNLKMWGYKFGNTIPYPADISYFTEWTNNGWPCGKVFRGFGIQIDTGGVACTVNLQVDGTTRRSWTINTTSPTRQEFLSPANDTSIEGYEYRLTFEPGSGGKAQLFGNVDWMLVNDACLFESLDTFNQAWGSAGYTIIKQIWADYRCTGTITVRIYDQDGVLFYSKQLPAHTTRAVEQFYLPSVYNGVLNKSRKHRVTITADDSTQRFQWYRDSARIEVLNLSSDQRKGYFQNIIWEQIQIAH